MPIIIKLIRQLSPRVKGFLLITLGTICISTVPVFSKLVLESMGSVPFTFYWMAGGFIYTILATIVRGPQKIVTATAKEWRYLILTGIFATLWVMQFFAGVKRLHPTVANLIFNVQGVWAIPIGLLILKERYSLAQLSGMTIIIAGVVLNIVDAGGPEELIGSLLVIGGALAYVCTNATIKQFVGRSGVLPALYARFTIPLIAFAVLSWREISKLTLDERSVALLAVGSFIGPFLSFVLIYSALKYFTVGIQSFFLTSSIFITALLSYFVFGSIPTGLQLVGGIVIVAGTFVMSLAGRS